MKRIVLSTVLALTLIHVAVCAVEDAAPEAGRVGDALWLLVIAMEAWVMFRLLRRKGGSKLSSSAMVAATVVASGIGAWIVSTIMQIAIWGLRGAEGAH